MKSALASLVIAFTVTATALSQAPDPSPPATAPAKPLAWDVISVRPNRSLDYSGGMQMLPNGFAIRNLTLHSLFGSAFTLKSGAQLIGAPPWTDSDRFDIQAKMDAETAAAYHSLKGAESGDQWAALCRQILEERFALKYHIEKRELPVYDLVVAKQGLKMKESAPDEENALSAGLGKFTAKKGGVTSLVYGLPVDRLIIDKTGLTGEYDIDLTWSSDNEPDSGPSIFTALQEQLGLKLEPAKAPVDVVVIDHFEHPSEN